jgi:16S rRNA (guanine527-N7)-methyltransferase
MKDTLKRYLDENNIAYSDKTLDRFVLYKDLLLKWNEKFNLTAITDEDGIAVKHFIDSLTIYKYVANKESLADIGTGAGFPGLPLKIAGYEGELVLVDSLKKRLGFLDEVINELGLINCSTVHSRAEDAGRGELREAFDVVTARAVAYLPVLSEYCLPLVKKGGTFIAMKGPEAEQELKDSSRAIEQLGAQIEKIEELQIEDLERRIIIIKKVRKTPPIYPRKAGIPKKNPL